MLTQRALALLLLPSAFAPAQETTFTKITIGASVVSTIRYGLPQAERVTLKIYSVLGEEVATLVDDEHKAAGYHVAIWDGRGKNGNVAASGVYVYRMRAGSFAMARKLALVK